MTRPLVVRARLLEQRGEGPTCQWPSTCCSAGSEGEETAQVKHQQASERGASSSARSKHSPVDGQTHYLWRLGSLSSGIKGAMAGKS